MTSDKGPAAPQRRPSPTPIGPRQVTALVILVLTVVFIAQNRDLVDIELLAIDVTAPLWVLLVVMVALGTLLGVLLARGRRR